MAETAARRNTLDRYELIAEIARGGMGTVYLARLEGVAGFQRLFAIKLMHPHLADDHQFVSMLLDEARIAARLHHPNAVEIIDICRSDRGYYLVMPYVEGFTLERLIEHPSVSPEQRVRLGLRVFCDAAMGLHAAHEVTNDDGTPLELVHRDVSPQNVLVGVDGTGRIADFGVARAAARITSSRPGVIKGKPCYMAPEQARNQPLDRRADVFALGIVLWEILTGEMLFFSEAGDAAMLVRVISDPVPRPSEKNPAVPEEVEAVCLKALERDRSARYQTARDLATELERAARDAGLLASTHEVSDELTALFGEEIENKRQAVKEHLSGLGRGSVPVVGSDVFDVPKLHPETGEPSRSASDPWHEEASTADTKLAKSEPAVAPVSEARGSSRWAAVAVVLAIVGLGAIAVAYFVSLGGGHQAEATEGELPVTATEAVTVGDTVADTERLPGTGTEQTPGAGTEAGAEQGPDTDTDTDTEVVADTVTATEAASDRAERPRERPPSKTRRTPMRTVPTLEDNPYYAQ